MERHIRSQARPGTPHLTVTLTLSGSSAEQSREEQAKVPDDRG